MRILTGPQISSILRNLSKQDGERLLDVLSDALASYSSQQLAGDAGYLHQPLRTVIQTSYGHTSLFMPVSDESTTAIKVATVPKQGAIQGAIKVFSDVGELIGLLNAAEITAFRTALATMTVMTRWNAAISGDAASERNVVIFGGGKQAEWHFRLILLLIPNIASISLMSRSSERLQEFVGSVANPTLKDYPGVQFTGVNFSQTSYKTSMQTAIQQSDIICCCTPSTEPLFSADDLRSSENPSKRFISLIGSYKPQMREIDTPTLRLAARIIVDSKEACLEEAGELIRAETKKEDLIEAGDLFSRSSRPNISDYSDLTIFKCVGLAIMDLRISQALLEMAAEQDHGTTIDGF